MSLEELFFNFSLDLFCIADMQGKICRVNPAMKKTLGFTTDELESELYISLIHPDDVSATSNEIEKLKSNATTTANYKNRCRSKDNNYKWIEWTGQKVPQEELLYLIGRDISLSVERERFFTVGSDLQAIGNFDGFFTWVSPSWEKTLGWTAQELTAHPWVYFVHPDDVEKTYREGEKLFQGIETISFENRYRCKDGSYRWISWRSRPFTDEKLMYGVAVDITERKEIAKTLADSQESLLFALEAAEMMAWTQDIRTGVVTQSKNAAKFLGLTENTPPEDFFNLIHPEESTYIRKKLQTAIAQKTLYSAEFRLVRPDGEIMWVADRGKVSYNELGEPIRISGVLIDINQRKQAEIALQESEGRKSLAIEAAQVGIWDYNLITGSLTWDAKCKELFGLPPDAEVTYETFLAGLHPEDRTRTDEVVQQAIDPTGTGEYDIDYRTIGIEDKVLRWLRAKGRVLFEEVAGKKRATRFVGTLIDVSDRMQIQQEAQQRVLQQQVVAELGLDALSGIEIITLMERAVTDLAKILDVEYAKVLELQESENTLLLKAGVGWQEGLVGVACVNAEETQAGYTLFVNEPVVVEDLRTETRFTGPKLLNDHQVVSGMSVVIQGHEIPYGVLGIHTKKKRLFSQNDVNFLVSVANILAQAIESKRVLANEQEARAQAERVNRLKDEFVSTLSHELRTPLNAILGWSMMLKKGTLNQTKMTEGLEIIERNVRVQTQLIEDLLDMSRILSGQMRLYVQQVELKAVIQAAVETVRLSATSKDIRLRTIIDPSAGIVSGDPVRLQQVVWNLLSNAIKFTPKGGRVQVVVSRVNSHVEISVIDTGLGISSEFLPYVFDRFRQADASTTRKYGGLGLGLAIVKHLVELHGGSVSAESAGEGKGATFTVCLPIAAVHSKPEEELRASSLNRQENTTDDLNTFALNGVKVLVVDDEPDTRELIKYILESQNAEVTTAGSVAEAILLFNRHNPNVLVSDIGMPEQDGYELIQRIRKLSLQASKIPAIALTAYAREADRKRSLLAGFQAHLTKPIDPTELVAVISNLVSIL